MNILLTAIGKRVQLIKHLRKEFNVIGTDVGELAPTINFVDKFYKIPKFNETQYLKNLLDICNNEKVDVLIPLYELEFKILSKNRYKFKKIGTELLLSNSKIIDICNNKYSTYEFLNDSIKCPKVYYERDIEFIIKEKMEQIFPLIIKPKNGMGSNGVFKINDLRELEFFKEYVKEPIIQEYIDGEEYTVDVLCDLNGKPVYIVPRKRLEVRSGEVSKSRTIYDNNIINQTLKIIDKFNAINVDGIRLMGPLTLQFFKTNENEIYFLEINPRLGGGVPLSFEAGANYSIAIKRMINKEKLEYKKYFKELTMLRFDDAIYF
ncbi:carbamoyl phosphate synthase-like protein [Clostridium novyi B str. ATCC 27606]|uniref:Carbamoyl phosphate synthase-like protein n=1 Tax=Clostridium novyi B str. ATCC 27606 TaxID=1443123 RepID=A0AA40ITZ8_CLONO|nr:ATP-grasp domain-containing protein [Clostridium novyi]KEI12085.1 carbamoyl phosphate synthase-like protein [Clostridium novyi B str. NCTC 9691]KEI15799.1 carbamoyl phosphate synthase-like protein [Clostridium novyi B str. ATCC 27606]